MKRILIILLVLLMAVLAGCKAPSAAPQETPAPETAVPEATVSPDGSEVLRFETVDVNGEPVSFADFADKKLIMVNLWETWCPPCMGELPDLEALYEKYRGEGFVILGVYSQSELSEVKSTVESLGIQYPVFEATSDFSRYRTQYVPTTVFVNAAGELMTDEPYIGSMTAAQWEQIITGLLGK